MSKLYLIPTPIGNLKDITLRALEILKNVDSILAEDTRKTKKLLNHYNITAQSASYHQHNEHRKLPKIITEYFNNPDNVFILKELFNLGLSDTYQSNQIKFNEAISNKTFVITGKLSEFTRSEIREMIS